MSETREELQKRLDKRWADFVVEITEMHNKFNQVYFQLQDTLGKLKSAVNPYNLPYGYGDAK